MAVKKGCPRGKNVVDLEVNPDGTFKANRAQMSAKRKIKNPDGTYNREYLDEKVGDGSVTRGQEMRFQESFDSFDRQEKAIERRYQKSLKGVESKRNLMEGGKPKEIKTYDSAPAQAKSAAGMHGTTRIEPGSDNPFTGGPDMIKDPVGYNKWLDKRVDAELAEGLMHKKWSESFKPHKTPPHTINSANREVFGEVGLSSHQNTRFHKIHKRDWSNASDFWDEPSMFTNVKTGLAKIKDGVVDWVRIKDMRGLVKKVWGDDTLPMELFNQSVSKARLNIGKKPFRSGEFTGDLRNTLNSIKSSMTAKQTPEFVKMSGGTKVGLVLKPDRLIREAIKSGGDIRTYIQKSIDIYTKRANDAVKSHYSKLGYIELPGFKGFWLKKSGSLEFPKGSNVRVKNKGKPNMEYTINGVKYSRQKLRELYGRQTTPNKVSSVGQHKRQTAFSKAYDDAVEDFETYKQHLGAAKDGRGIYPDYNAAHEARLLDE